MCQLQGNCEFALARGWNGAVCGLGRESKGGGGKEDEEEDFGPNACCVDSFARYCHKDFMIDMVFAESSIVAHR